MKLYHIKDLNDPLTKVIKDDPVRPHIPLEQRVNDLAEILILKAGEEVLAATCMQWLSDIPEDEADLVEMEHTNDPDIAKEIAMDHLTEDPDYYSKLIKAGLATEFQPSHNSGFGDPDQSFNDVPRVGKGGLKKGNMHGKIGGTPNDIEREKCSNKR